jgi:nitrogen fixation protein NifU and related proteins
MADIPDSADKRAEAVKQAPAAYVDHARRPKNARAMPDANGFASLTAHDGSATEVWLRIDGDIVKDASFWTEGCGTTIACGSMSTETVKGKTVAEAFQITADEIDSALGGLPNEGCVCAALVVDTLRAALRNYLSFKNEPWRRGYVRS